MSLDNRLRQELDQLASGPLPEPIDIGSDLLGVLAAGRRRKVLHRAYRGLAIVALLFLAAFAVPSLLRQAGIQLNTDVPPANQPERDHSLGTTSESSETGDPPLGIGTGAGRGQTGEAAQGSVGPRQGGPVQKGSATVPKVPTPMAAGTYSYDLSGYFCGELSGCGSGKERKDTYDRPSGSHQRSTSRWTTSRGKFDAEYGYDFRPDGVYWEHFNYTVTDNNGVVADTYACPELAVTPHRVWHAGAKPGDHFEDTPPCNPYYLESGPGVTIVDIVRAETVSIGGRDVSTLFVRVQWRRSNNRYNITEGWVFPDKYLFVKEDLSWSTEHNSGEYHTLLESMSPS